MESLGVGDAGKGGDDAEMTVEVGVKDTDGGVFGVVAFVVGVNDNNGVGGSNGKGGCLDDDGEVFGVVAPVALALGFLLAFHGNTRSVAGVADLFVRGVKDMSLIAT